MSRGRVLTAVAVTTGVVLVVGLGAWQMFDSSSTGGACGLYGEEADAVIYWPSENTPPEFADDEQRSMKEDVRAVGGVGSVEAWDSEETWERLVDSAEAAGVEVSTDTAPVWFPSSIAVSFTEAGWEEVERVQADLTDAPWARAVLSRDEPGGPFREVVSDRWGPVDLVVFLQPGAPAESLELVASDLDAADGVEQVETFTQDQAYDEFVELFADSPELVATVTPEILPSSVRVTMTDPGDIERTEALATSVEGEADVREVLLPLSALLFQNPLFADIADGC